MEIWKRSNDIMEELTKHCDIILGNEEDAKKHFNIHPEDVDVRDAQSIDAIRYQSVCRQLKEKFQMPRKLSPHFVDQLMPITILGQVFFTMEKIFIQLQSIISQI